jgi:hypothetical protein
MVKIKIESTIPTSPSLSSHSIFTPESSNDSALTSQVDSCLPVCNDIETQTNLDLQPEGPTFRLSKKSEKNTSNKTRVLKHKEKAASKASKRKRSVSSEPERFSEPKGNAVFNDSYLFDNEAEEVEMNTASNQQSTVASKSAEETIKKVITNFNLAPDTRIVLCKLSDLNCTIRKPPQLVR